MRKQIVVILVCLFCIASGCREVDIPADQICKPLPHSPSLGWNYLFNVPRVGGACFNPNNAREIVYIDYSHDPQERSLCIFNIDTHEKRYIYSGDIGSLPSWGKNGWILFGTVGGNIHRIHESGGSLVSLTSGGGNWDPVWNVDGERYAFRNNSNGTNSTYIFSHDHTPIDTLRQSGIGLSWNHPRYSPTAAAAWLVLSDMEHDSLVILENEPDDGFAGGGAIFIDDRTLVYSYPSGIYAMDILTKETTVLRESCNSILYKFPDYSTELQKLIWLKITLEPQSDSRLFEKSEIVLMDVDGGNDEVLELQ